MPSRSALPSLPEPCPLLRRLSKSSTTIPTGSGIAMELYPLTQTPTSRPTLMWDVCTSIMLSLVGVLLHRQHPHLLHPARPAASQLAQAATPNSLNCTKATACETASSMTRRRPSLQVPATRMQLTNAQTTSRPAAPPLPPSFRCSSTMMTTLGTATLHSPPTTTQRSSLILLSSRFTSTLLCRLPVHRRRQQHRVLLRRPPYLQHPALPSTALSQAENRPSTNSSPATLSATTTSSVSIDPFPATSAGIRRRGSVQTGLEAALDPASRKRFKFSTM
jgi:hypothetical protein